MPKTSNFPRAVDMAKLTRRIQRRVRDPLPEKLWKYLPPFPALPRLTTAPAAALGCWRRPKYLLAAWT